MGIIRGTHVSPGIYTKTTSIRTRGIKHVSPASTLYANSGSGGGTSSRFYFGYIPVTSYNGKITEESINQILQLTGDEIKNMRTVEEKMSPRPEVPLEEVRIPSELSVSEFDEKLNRGEAYADVADPYNSCPVLMIPLRKYEKSGFDIFDNVTGVSIKNIFSKINDVEVNKVPYVLLCMFNDLWGYARVGEDKTISPLTLKFKS